MYIFVELHYNLYNKRFIPGTWGRKSVPEIKEHETHLTCSFRFPIPTFTAISSQHPISSSIQKELKEVLLIFLKGNFAVPREKLCDQRAELFKRCYCTYHNYYNCHCSH